MIKQSPKESLPIAVDAMGGDFGPAEVVAGAQIALENVPSLEKVILVGDQDLIEPMLRRNGLWWDPRVELRHAGNVIAMEDKARDGYRKKDSSMIKAIDLVRQGEARAVVSCGNTGVLMFSGTIMLRKLPGVERAALATVIPSDDCHFLLVDAGAQPDTSASQLVHNGIMGSNYCSAVLPYERPRVGLLTIGTEEGKGTDRIAKAHEQFKQLEGLINYIGLIEGFDVFQNKADVVVCDGFTGNILLKSLESCFNSLKGRLKQELTANPVRKTGAFLAQGAFKAVKRAYDPEHYAGAPLLGLNELILKTHGSSNRGFIANAIRIALETLQHDLGEHIEKDVESARQILKSTGSTQEASRV